MHIDKNKQQSNRRRKKTIRKTVRDFLLQVTFFLYFFYLYHNFISVTCPMCRRPIYQEDQDGEEKVPPSSSTRLQWIRSRLSFGRLSISPLTRFFKTCSRLITTSGWDSRSNTVEENTQEDSETVSIEMQQPLELDSEESDLPFSGTHTDVLTV